MHTSSAGYGLWGVFVVQHRMPKWAGVAIPAGQHLWWGWHELNFRVGWEGEPQPVFGRKMQDSKPPPPCDQELLSLIGTGDRGAFAVFFRLHVGTLRRFLRVKGLAHREVEDDLVQEIFLKVWRKATSFNPTRGQVQSWLLAIAQNCLYDYWRRIQRSMETSTEDIPEAGPADDFIGEQRARHEWLTVQSALDSFGEVEKRIFRLVYVEGCTMEQCAQQLAIPSGTVKWRISLLKKALRARVAERLP